MQPLDPAIPSPPVESAEEAVPIEVFEPLCAVFRRTLKGEGLKYTPERAHVLDTIIRCDGPFQAEQIVESVRDVRVPPGGQRLRISKATVYRTIKLLLDAGIIQRLPLDNEQGVYHLVYGRRPNDMIIRTDTREMIPLDLPDLGKLVEAACHARGLTLKGHRLYVFAEERRTVASK